MKVKDLIAFLGEFDPDQPVMLEPVPGSGCYNDVQEVTEDWEIHVLADRSHIAAAVVIR